MSLAVGEAGRFGGIKLTSFLRNETVGKKAKTKEKVALKAVKRRDGRYAVEKRSGGYLNGAEKQAFLHSQGLIKLSKPKGDKAKAAAE
jgi:hypothetical protein